MAQTQVGHVSHIEFRMAVLVLGPLVAVLPVYVFDYLHSVVRKKNYIDFDMLYIMTLQLTDWLINYYYFIYMYTFLSGSFCDSDQIWS